MKTLKYTIIKTREQYDEYCNILEKLVFSDGDELQDEIELLTLLIEKWDEEHNSFRELTPVEMLRSIMQDHDLKAKDIAEIVGLSKGTISKILNYQAGFSKDVIRKLSEHFKISQEAINKKYDLVHKQRIRQRKRVVS